MNSTPVLDLDNDDELEGTLLTRRRALGLLGLGGLATISSAGLMLSGRGEAASKITSLPGCVVTPAKTVGPYFKEEHLIRSDLRSDTRSGKVSAGVPLSLTFRVLEVGAGVCAPLSGITIDVWQADAQGVYSDIGGEHTLGQNYLRGAQVTDAGSGKLIEEGCDEVSGRLKFRWPLQRRAAMPSGPGLGSIFGGGQELSCGCTAEDLKRGPAGRGSPVLAFDS